MTQANSKEIRKSLSILLIAIVPILILGFVGLQLAAAAEQQEVVLQGPFADVGITKVADRETVTAGEQLTYTLTVINNDGTISATNVVVSDTLPGGLTIASSLKSVDGLSCDEGGNPIVCELGDVDPGTSEIITVVVNVDPDKLGIVTNDAKVGSDSPDNKPLNDTSFAEVTVVAEADLNLDKTASSDTVVAGEHLTYTLTISNAGPSDASGIVITDALPAGTTYASSGGANCSPNNNQVGCTLADPLTVGPTVVITVAVDVNSDALGLLTNDAVVSSDATDNNGGNDNASAGVTATAEADLNLEKTVSSGAINAGERLTYTLTISNPGPSDADNVIISDTLPAGTTYASSGGANCSPNNNVISCTLDSPLAAGNSAVVSLFVDVDSDALGTLTNFAEVSSSAKENDDTDNADSVPVTVNAEADLSLTKTANSDTVVAGERLTYTLTVNNPGPSQAAAVAVTDTLVGLATFDYWATSVDGTCNTSGDPVICNLGDLDVGGTAVITLAVDVNPAASGTLENNAVVGSDTADPDDTNDGDGAIATISREADLSITKIASPASVIANEQITYSLIVNNIGPSLAANVTVTDTLPDDVSLAGFASDPAVSCSFGNPIVCDLNDLDIGDTTFITLVVDVDSAASGTLVNNAIVGSDTFDPNSANDTESADTTVVNDADLSLSKIASADSVIAGRQLTYTLTVTNNSGPSIAAAVRVTDTLPSQLTLSSWDTSVGGTCPDSGNPIVCDLNDLGVGATAVVTLVVDVGPGATGAQNNIAIVGSGSTDPNSGNDQDNAVTTVTSEADLSLAKSASPDTVVAGQQLTYTLIVSNNGPSLAKAVVVTDSLPVTVTVAGWNTSVGGVCITSSNPVDCKLNDLAPGATAVITLVVDVDPAAFGTLDNNAAVSSNTFDPVDGNNRDGASTPVTNAADLSLAKSASPTQVVAGERVTYTLTVDNHGPSLANNISISDTLPAGTILFGYDSDPAGAFCTNLNNVLNCSMGSLAVNAGAVLTLVVDVNSGVSGSLTNFAEVSSDAVDTNATNDLDSATVVLDALADLGLEKTANSATVAAGGRLTYTLSVSNAGPSLARGVIVTDTLPDGVVAADWSVDKPGASCDDSGNPVVCTIGDLELGASTTITLEVTVGGAAAGTIINEAEVGSVTPDGDPGNDSDTLETSVTALVDLAVGKSGDPNPVIAGGIVTYTIIVNNNGPSNATGVQIIDTLPASATFVSAVVEQSAVNIQTIEAWQWSPPSPDTAGLVYIPSTNRILASDSEVNERVPPIFQGVNLYDITLDGNLVGTDFTEYSDEPTGLAYDPATETLFVSDDNGTPRAIYVVDSAGNVLSTINTRLFPGEPLDPEGVAFDTINGELYMVDGVGHSVYRINPGDDGIFNGVVEDGGDDIVTSFDVNPLGIADPEGLAFNYDTGTLYVGDHAQPRIIEATTDGVLLRTIDITEVGGDVAGLTYGPSSVNPSARSLYVADRGFDNSPPTEDENDGRIYEIALSSGGTCSDGPIVTCDIGSLAAGGLSVIRLKVRIHPSATITVSNSVQVNSLITDVNPANNTATAINDVISGADLSITKVASDEPATAGQALTYTLSISNPGPSNAAGVVVTDTLPAGTIVSSTVASQGGCIDGPLTVCSLGTISAGGQATVTLVVTVESTVVSTLVNLAEVSSVTSELLPDNNTVTVTTTVASEADLAVTKSGLPEPVSAGRNLTYTIVISNLGPSAASSIRLTDTLPAGTQLVSWSASPEIGCDGIETLLCNFDTLPITDTATISIVVQLSSAMSITVANTATVKSASFDPDLANNTGRADNAINTEADLILFKEDWPDPVAAGSLLTYTLTISNPGPSDAIGVVVTDTLPPEAFLHSSGTSQGSGCIENVDVICSFGDVTAGQEVSATVVISLDAGLQPTILLNSAIAGSSTSDPQLANNQIEITTTTKLETDLAIAKTAAPDPVTAGEQLLYTLTITNFGPSNASGVTVTDTLPGEATFVSASSVPGSGCAPGSIVLCSLGDLAVGSTIQITISAHITPSASFTVENAAVVGGQQFDPVAENNEVTLVSGVIRLGSLPLRILDDPEPVVAGSYLTYTLHVSSTGPSDANGVVLTDSLPAQVTFVTATFGTDFCNEESPRTVVCQLGDMPVGSDATVTILTLVEPGASGQIVNTAVVKAEDGAESEVGETTFVRGVADLAVFSSTAPNPVIAGQSLTYTVVVSNRGPSLATQVELKNSRPSAITLKSGPGCSQSAAFITCNLGNLAAGTTTTVTFVVDVGPAATGELLSTASALSNNTDDPDDSNNAAETITQIEVVSDLGIDKSASSAEVLAGEKLTYTLTISNSGPSEATGVQVSDVLSTGVSLLSAEASQGDCGLLNPVLCDLGTIPFNASATVTMVVDVLPSTTGVLLNDATVSVDPQDVLDPNSTNNTVGESTAVTTLANLNVTKVHATDPITAGLILSYTITVGNPGPSDARSVVLTDTLPAGATPVTATLSNGGSCDLAGPVVCPLGDIAPGQIIIVDLWVDVSSAQTEMLLNGVIVGSETPDADLSDNSSDEETGVVTAADLKLELVGAPNPVVAGDLLTYTLTISNAGPSDATGIVVTSTLPAEVELLALTLDADVDCGADLTPPVVCQIDSLGAGSSAMIAMKTQTDIDVVATVVNTATISAEQTDPIMASNSITESTFIAEKIYVTFMPIIQNGIPTGEPNDTCEQAYGIRPNHDFWFLPEDVPDWYEFDLAVGGRMTVYLRNFTPRFGQIVVYKGDTCDDRVVLAQNGDDGTSKTLQIPGSPPPGHYFIFVGNDGPKSQTERYMLRVSVTP